MSIITNTVQTFGMVGIREELSDRILNIAPTDTPFTSMAKKGKTSSRNPEWQRDTLASPDPTNAQIEGNDLVSTSGTTGQPDRLKNIVQLFDKKVTVSDTAIAVNTAGRTNELKYQVAKKSKEIAIEVFHNYLAIVIRHRGVLGGHVTERNQIMLAQRKLIGLVHAGQGQQALNESAHADCLGLDALHSVGDIGILL